MERAQTFCISFLVSTTLIACTQQDLPSNKPPTVLLEAPFTSQAPFGNWDAPYQEACEEAALIIAYTYLQSTPLTPESADKEIVHLTTWVENQNLPEDISVKDLAWVATNRYGLTARVIEHPSIDEIQYELERGNVVIVPAAGRELLNPYYSGEGPWYHMLVIVGYTETEFITHDPGTRRGKNYRYTFDTIMDAIHDWTGVKEEIGTGVPRVLIVTQQQSS